MTRPHLIARLIFAAMGVYLLIEFLDYIRDFSLRYGIVFRPETRISSLLIIAIAGAILFTASLILLFRSDWLVRLTIGPDTTGCEKVDEYQIKTSFRTIACLCGLLILYQPISLLIVNLPTPITGQKILSYMTFEGQSSLLSTKTLARILVEVIKGIFAIYLIFGAPHYARWLIRTTKAKEQNQTCGV
jgi:hypothetical protein